MDKSPSKFASDAMRFPLFVGDPAKLAAKLGSAGGLLRQYWNDFQNTMMSDQEKRSQMIYLPALLSDEFRAEAKETLKKYYLTLRETDTANDFQFHTWCRCGSVTRRAAFFDWLASCGVWSQKEIEQAAECFLGFGFKHPYMVLTGRGRSSNNQALSMALYCAAVGFLFGYKLTDHPTGKFLFDYGMGRLPDLIGLFPEDGYGGEGSTYTSHVNTPLSYWTCELLRQVTGRDLLDTPFRPNGTTLRKLLELELRLISPGGLLAPWDHYGWQRGVNASPFAYLARATGNPRYLSLVPSLDLWSDPGYLAWGADDPMWTLVWWPEEHKGYADAELPAELFGWFLPKTGAALDDPARRARLMQVWDISANTFAGVGRAQVNPNHLMMDYGGEPVFQDGVGDQEKDPWQFPPRKVLERFTEQERERYFTYLNTIGVGKGGLGSVIIGASPGLIGGANAIVVDDEPWYWPGSSRVGNARFYAAREGLQVVSADCANFYQPRYDVTLARRTSLWTDAGFGVVLDTLAADSPHTWRWQVYLRPDVEIEGSAARVKLPNGSSVLLAWEPGCNVRTEPVDGFPRTQEARSTRLDLLADGPGARFAVVIAPDARAASIRRISNCLVEVSIDGATHGMIVENFGEESMAFGEKATSAIFAWRPPRGSVVEITGGAVEGVKPDIHDLSDIEADRELQLKEIEELVRWDAEAAVAGETRLSQIDACLAQLPAERPDIGTLITGLRSPYWPVQVAAAEVLGRRGCAQAIPALRELLEAEHARAAREVYPDDEADPAGRSVEDLAKRWRLKTALIVALGRLGDADAVPLLGRILADGRDFYIVYSVAAQALGRIGGSGALRALEPAFAENEVNTHFRAQAAKEYIERTC